MMIESRKGGAARAFFDCVGGVSQGLVSHKVKVAFSTSKLP